VPEPKKATVDWLLHLLQWGQNAEVELFALAGAAYDYDCLPQVSRLHFLTSSELW